MATPTLTVIAGPPGAGKTTLAHGLAERLGRPVVCRDAIKEGMVDAVARPLTEAEHDELNLRTLAVFFELVELLLRAETSVIAEAAYQDRLWRPGLTPLLDLGRVLVVRCRVDIALARSRQELRLAGDPRRAAHADREHLARGEVEFEWPRLDVPTLDLTMNADPGVLVETTAEFVLGARGA